MSDCPVCLDQISGRKSVILHCKHVVHLDCAKKSCKNSQLICGTCSKVANVPEGPESLPIFRAQNVQESDYACCKLHAEEFSRYCHSCVRMICDICVEEHSTHALEPLDDIVSSKRVGIAQMVKKTQNWQNEAHHTIDFLVEQKNQMMDQCSKVKESVAQDFKYLRTVIREMEQQNIQRIDEFMKRKDEETEKFVSEIGTFMEESQKLNLIDKSTTARECQLCEDYDVLCQKISNSKILKDKPLLATVSHKSMIDTIVPALQSCEIVSIDSEELNTSENPLLQLVKHEDIEEILVQYPEQEEEIWAMGICFDRLKIRTLLNQCDGIVAVVVNELLDEA